MSKLTDAQKAAKLKALAEIEGYEDVQELLEAAVFDSVVPAICTECGATYDLEPDAQDDLCDECDCETVSSCLILAGII